MLKGLKLTNFRGFDSHELPFRPITVAVGRNNAGKSTFVESLRLISIVTNRYQNLSYRKPPDWLQFPIQYSGASVDFSNLQIDFESIFYEYQDPPAVIEAFFTNGRTIKIYIGGEKKIHAVLLDKKERVVRTRSEAGEFIVPRVSILPQVSPLAREEKVLSRDYVLGTIDSPLASSHFRNQLKLNPHLLPEFRHLAEETWPGLQIRELSYSRGYPGDPIYLEVRNEEFVGEVGKMGHGLQMWLQCIWFLVRSRTAKTLILDEPDVYMHADLQRRLVRYLRAQSIQFIIATHSVEIISEVEPQDILVIERKRRSSQFMDSLPSVQKVLERVGSTQNIHLSRLWNARKFLLVEGDDLRLLKLIHDKLFPNSFMSLGAVPNMSIGGWGGWAWAVGSSMAMKNAFGETVQCYCILDRDYHLEEEVIERIAQAQERGVHLHVWMRKELENYFLEPSAIVRIILKQRPHAKVSEEDVLSIILTLADKMEDDVIDGLAELLCHKNRGLNVGGANKRARTILEAKRSRERGIIDVVSGKILLSRLSDWSHNNFGVNLSPGGIARSINISEIDSELINVIKAIEDSRPLFPPR